MSRDSQARLVRSLFQQFKSCNEQAIGRAGEIDVTAIASILAPALQDDRMRLILIPALAYFIGSALDGSVDDMTSWSPPPPK